MTSWASTYHFKVNRSRATIKCQNKGFDQRQGRAVHLLYSRLQIVFDFISLYDFVWNRLIR